MSELVVGNVIRIIDYFLSIKKKRISERMKVWYNFLQWFALHSESNNLIDFLFI